MNIEEYKPVIIETLKELKIEYTEVLITHSYINHTGKWMGYYILSIISEDIVDLINKELIIRESLNEKGIFTMSLDVVDLPYNNKGLRFTIGEINNG